MSQKKDIDSKIKEVNSKKAHIEMMMERGAKCIVLEYGSHSLKYGLAKDDNPQTLRMLIAQRQTGNNDNHSPLNMLPSKMDNAANKIKGNWKLLDAELRKTGNIKDKLPNAQGYTKITQGLKQETIKLTERKRPDKLRDYFYGEDVYFVEGRDDYQIRQPIQYGFLNINSFYKKKNAIYDLELLTREALSRLGITTNLSQFSVMISAPDKFHRGQYKAIITMLLRNIGFNGFYIHLQSVLASFGAGVNPSCVVNIGYSSITVVTVEDGLVIDGSVLKKSFGGVDIDFILKSIIEQKDAVAFTPKGSKMNCSKYKTMAVFEKMREAKGNLVSNNEILLQMNSTLPAELNEPSVISVHLSQAFVVAPASLFYPLLLDNFHKEEMANPENKTFMESKYFSDYHDEEDIRNEDEIRLNLIMEQSKNSDFITMKKEIMVRNKIDEKQLLNQFRMSDLQTMISYSLFQLKEGETRKKVANNLVLTGGLSVTPNLPEMMEDSFIDKISLFDPNIERVEVRKLISNKVDSRTLTWTGATIIPKLDCMRGQFISRGKWLADVDNIKYPLPDKGKEDGDKGQKNSKRIIESPEFGLMFMKEKISFAW